MQTLFIGFVDDSVMPQMKGIAIRIAYLLSTQFRMSGDDSYHFAMAEDMHNFSFEQKLIFLDEREKGVPEPNNFYQKYKQTQKAFKTPAGYRKEVIVAKKQMEITVDKIFKRIFSNMVKGSEELGLANLKGIQNSLSYGEYYISRLTIESDNENVCRLSEVLQLNLDEEDNKSPFIFILNYPFLLPEFDLGDTIMPKLNSFSENGFLQELFTLSNYNNFSVADLNTIRFEIKSNLENFQQAINVFAALTEKPAEAFDHLQNNIVPAAAALSESLNGTSLIGNYKNFMPAATNIGKLYLGMVPRHVLFKYFEFTKAANEKTIEVLDRLSYEERHLFVPVLITSMNKNFLEKEPDIADTELMPLKKSLSID